MKMNGVQGNISIPWGRMVKFMLDRGKRVKMLLCFRHQTVSLK